MTYVLGIHEMHEASAALMRDGKLVAAASEERFTGLKADYGYPHHAIAYCLSEAGISSAQLDAVALASHNLNPVLMKIKRGANFSVDDWVREQHSYWKPLLFEKKRVDYYSLFKDNPEWSYENTYASDSFLDGYMEPEEMKAMQILRISTVSGLFGVPSARVRTVTHEDCHTFYGYFSSNLRCETLALTAEGIGDYSNGSVSRFSVHQQTNISYTLENHLGHIYQYITLLLGMKPGQHEYKVMGLAPYSTNYEASRSYEVFRRLLRVEGIDIVYDQAPRDLYCWVRDRFEGHRFDGIAGGLQRFTEELLAEWVKAASRFTGLSRVCFTGGVAQNIKACKKIAELDGIEDPYIPPASGDTSVAIGACYAEMWRHLNHTGQTFDSLAPLENIYLGPEFSTEEVEETLSQNKVREHYDVTSNTSPSAIAQLLEQGLVIARCSDRMEFGLRALGNRSILADPRNAESVQKINSKIKYRDFWMPFTPTVLAKRQDNYIENPKSLRCPYMTMAFDTTAQGRREIPAAIHPADFTVRPQILEEAANPEYYAIIGEFEKLTGVGALLNTSFNLHGNPIVLGPQQAIDTMNRSALDAVIIGRYLVTRK